VFPEGLVVVVAESSIASGQRDPAWDVARLFPVQGAWTVNDYTALTDLTNQLVEYTDGRVEVLDVPTETHQLLVRFLIDALRAFVEPRQLGEVLFAPLRVRISASKFREPDVVFMLRSHAERRGEEYWEGADLVLEVVSNNPIARRRDTETKRLDYAEAGIPEYWIVDPTEKRVTVLTLAGGAYVEHGQFGTDTVATSCLLSGFSLDVAQLFRVGNV
jgi:Uma2 family endonuclease